MKAIQYSRLGGPEVLRWVDVPDPSPGPDDAIVEVKAAGVNHLDLHFRRGLPGVQGPLPHIPGSDASGVIVDLGKNVRHLSIGARVLMNPCLQPDGDYEIFVKGEQAQHRQRILGRETDGSYAQKILIPARNAIPIPDHINFEEAAAVPLVYLTAWRMVVSRARVIPGETILVLGSGSGVSIAAIQLASLMGARVLTTASSKKKADQARAKLPIEDVILYKEEAIDEGCRKRTQKRGVDVVIDHVGGSQWVPILRATANGGRIVTCGATAGFDPKTDLRQIFFRQLTVMGSTMGDDGELAQMLRLFFQGKLKPIIDEVIPLVDAARAHHKMENQESFGKIILQP